MHQIRESWQEQRSFLTSVTCSSEERTLNGIGTGHIALKTARGGRRNWRRRRGSETRDQSVSGIFGMQALCACGLTRLSSLLSSADFETAAERTYNRQIRDLKPNVSAYQSTKADSYVGPTSASSSALIHRGDGNGQLISRADIDTAYSHLTYGDHKPSDVDVDRLVSHLNME